MVSNRVARGKLINQLTLEKTKQKDRLNGISEGVSKDCLNTKLPDSILDSLRME